jgi:DNA primase
LQAQRFLPMITKPTIDRIMEATDIVEVIGEFVQLKKRGANYVGLSPFANERTPSFTVSPAKGIFKDFSSGKGGSAITFLMELEKFTYPEALKWLAKKYGIEVEETEMSAEDKAEDNRRESLMIVSGYAAKFFHESLLDTDEGQSIGLSYFKERGFHKRYHQKVRTGLLARPMGSFQRCSYPQRLPGRVSGRKRPICKARERNPVRPLPRPRNVPHP